MKQPTAPRVSTRVTVAVTRVRQRGAYAIARLETRRDAVLAGPAHQPRTAAILGVALGVCFSICFATGLLSHLIQHPPTWFSYPARPAGLYRVTQGLHVATGMAAIPLLLGKLWSVLPHLFQTPPVRNVAHLLERVSLIPLVAGSIFLLFSGTNNVAKWYPYKFDFVPAHYSVAWITMGAMVVHLGAKASTTRLALSRAPTTGDQADNQPTGSLHTPGRLSRRGFLTAVAGGAGIVTIATVGETIGPLKDVALLAARRPDRGVDHVPVNRSARGAHVTDAAQALDYRLVIDGQVHRPLSFTLQQLNQLPQHEATLPIACVEGWSASARWRGVRVRDLLTKAGAAENATITVHSLQTQGLYAFSELDADHTADPDTLLAIQMNGKTLALDHGYPLRLIAPNRPGVMQTKWVNRLEVK